MKVVAFILSIYFLALNFSPCEDNSVVTDELKTEISQSTSDGHLDFDLCSPFCQCHCCHIHATNFNQSDFMAASTDISTEVFFHADGLEKDFNNSILQPPRV
ncbi:MAG: hypothetical protein CL605_03260 [Altibacter sp.]|uniref:DUF6660 family protein n=1 Tax=Altibacter sp. TaxID=2024823 RepID=UPI000C938A2B|nr:DUF6660 family protein [Altibacter sp.]MAP53899.1 hypothetical protein [Altibacter sp.]|tara:strand:+ start:612 stop:917 length:306 start_codon:yes stop_codon:yes gene_type:complete